MQTTCDSLRVMQPNAEGKDVRIAQKEVEFRSVFHSFTVALGILISENGRGRLKKLVDKLEDAVG